MDNKALTFMNKWHLNNSRITRWILTIQEYKFDIVHCKGKENIVADTLSRNPEDVTEGGQLRIYNEQHCNQDLSLIHI